VEFREGLWGEVEGRVEFEITGNVRARVNVNGADLLFRRVFRVLATFFAS
jgi:hypothetical protein